MYFLVFIEETAKLQLSMATRKHKKCILIAGYCRIESDDINIVEGIISMIFEYQKLAAWSGQYKGSQINLTDDDTKAIAIGPDEGHSVRADFAIARGDIVE